MMRRRVNLLGLWVDRVTIEEALTAIQAFLHAARPHQIVTANLDFLRLGRQDAGFRALVNSADLVVADGMPLVWASHMHREPLPQRISGVDLIHACARIAATQGYRIFLLGAAPGVADEAAAALERLYPGLHIAGTYAPPFTGDPAANDARALAAVRSVRPDILLVAFGAPRQEEWISNNKAALNIPVCMGVGGSLDMLAGRVRRAPRWMQHSGLEWLFRLLQEPRRLWKRYLVHDLPVFVRLLIQDRPQTDTTPAPIEETGSLPGRRLVFMARRAGEASDERTPVG
jgi:N-acetylglucosaminyldiphosphoundecaprenol N-acetyl-beta-D-mannosaminyltransferase